MRAPALKSKTPFAFYFPGHFRILRPAKLEEIRRTLTSRRGFAHKVESATNQIN